MNLQMSLSISFSGKHEIYSFKESSTCEYEIIVLSPLLCDHPDYRPEEANENVIECKPLDEKTPYKPRNLIQLEAESLKLRSEKMFEGNFMQGDTPGKKKRDANLVFRYFVFGCPRFIM